MSQNSQIGSKRIAKTARDEAIALSDEGPPTCEKKNAKFCFFGVTGEHWPSLADCEPAKIRSSDTPTRNFFVMFSKNMYELHACVFRCGLEFLIIVFGMF